MARDAQRHLVYAWERVACPTFGKPDEAVTPSVVRAVIRRVHADVILAGGFASDAPVVKFTKRNGSACASWGMLKFTPTRLNMWLTLHEIAHSLTFNPRVSQVAMRNRCDRTPIQDHALRFLTLEGHGPRYVACFMALLERYAGLDLDHMLSLARSFRYQALGPWRIVRQQSDATGRVSLYRTREPVMRTGSIRVDMTALSYWRNLLRE
jgi:hypothetical protein